MELDNRTNRESLQAATDTEDYSSFQLSVVSYQSESEDGQETALETDN
jgi:hypothetical protein